MLGAVGIVTATAVGVVVAIALVRVLTIVAVAGFFALVLAPAVRSVEVRLGGHRTLATALVVATTVLVLGGFAVLFVLPIRAQLVAILSDLPGTVRDAADGKGPVGNALDRLGLAGYVQNHEAELQRAADRMTGSQFEMARRAFGWLVTSVTVLLLTVLMLSQSTAMSRGALDLVPHRRRESVRRASRDAADAVSGYMIGNLLISVIAGVAGGAVLIALGVPNALVLALLVAFTDLIPLVGATIGAAVCVAAAFLHEPRAGVIAIVFFVLYQQLENTAIYPSVMARTVQVNPLVVLLSVLVGVELFGIVGAVLAVPVSGVAQVAIRAARSEMLRERLVLPVLERDEREPA